MGDIVNLRMARKRKQRAEKDKLATENREKHGRTREERIHLRMSEEKARRDLDLHRRERQEDSDESSGS